MEKAKFERLFLVVIVVMKLVLNYFFFTANSSFRFKLPLVNFGYFVLECPGEYRVYIVSNCGVDCYRGVAQKGSGCFKEVPI